MSARPKKKITIYLEQDLARALDLEARLRGLPTTRAAADALRRIFLDEKDEAVADTVKMRLDRLEKREVVREREIAIVKETLLLFIRVWLDQPGRVIAQVSENVFDSVTGEVLLIPQGARLLGSYDADTAYGERRLLVVWNRLIMPNGWSIPLRAMPGADAAGSAGLTGDVDAHIGRIVVASLISAVLGVAANESEDEDDARLSQSIGDAAAQQAAQTGSRIVDRELNVRPTLRVRAGARVRVLVSQDIQLRPYPP